MIYQVEDHKSILTNILNLTPIGIECETNFFVMLQLESTQVYSNEMTLQ